MQEVKKGYSAPQAPPTVSPLREGYGAPAAPPSGVAPAANRVSIVPPPRDKK